VQAGEEEVALDDRGGGFLWADGSDRERQSWGSARETGCRERSGVRGGGSIGPRHERRMKGCPGAHGGHPIPKRERKKKKDTNNAATSGL